MGAPGKVLLTALGAQMQSLILALVAVVMMPICAWTNTLLLLLLL